MRCWRCDDREATNELGLCAPCDDELHGENTIPPGERLHPPGTLPEAIGPYTPPPPNAYVTYPTGMPIEVTEVEGGVHVTTPAGVTYVYTPFRGLPTTHQSIAVELLDL